MSSNRSFLKSRERLVHVSAPIIPNPARLIELAAQGHSILPEHIVGPRTTFFKRKNENKRRERIIKWRKGTKLTLLAFPVVRCTKKVTP